jgi:hypothetical protein
MALNVSLAMAAILICLPGADSKAQISSAQRADSLFAAGNHEEAARAYRRAAEQRPDVGRLWFQLGLSHHLQGQYRDAGIAFVRAHRLGFGLPTTSYNLACAYSLQGHADEAFAWLDSAISEGMNNVELVQGDSDLEILRSDPRYGPLLARIRDAASPCEFTERCHDLDFWVGDWDVFGPDERLVGRDIISKVLNGCLIFQQWHSGFGNEGKSMRYWDPASEVWRCTWVDAQGGVTWYEGEFTDGVMEFTGERTSIGGEIVLERASLRPLDDGRVHHLIEHSIDSGKSWFLYFDGYYVRREATAEGGGEQ